MTGASAPERTIEVHDPASGEIVGRAAVSGPAEVEGAVAEAAAAQRDWARRHPAERGRCLAAAAAAVVARAPELAELQTRENGRPVGESLAGVLAGAGTLEEYARLGPLHGGGSLRGGWDALDVVVPEPRGVAVALVPWNDPIAIACGPIGACLATGNALVLKPSEKTPLSSALLGEVLAEHLPPGALTVLSGGPETGRLLVRADGLGVVLHTGSVATGREVAAACGERLVKVVAELGGKDPLVVDEDVDPGWAAEQAASGAFANAGQVCTSVERIYVHEKIHDDFVDH
ncbi:MAG TPA: aldehyde dehydrogenase family protein, partial [Miltoncostaeaceae bacterium]|nr:aldehyde dehydrogenase family protein [Miltoncostaeaceae bacterium]